jgi:hypothetical protein
MVRSEKKAGDDEAQNGSLPTVVDRRLMDRTSQTAPSFAPYAERASCGCIRSRKQTGRRSSLYRNTNAEPIQSAPRVVLPAREGGVLRGVIGADAKRGTQVIRAIVKFWERERDSSGMPNPYRCYLVLSSPRQNQPGSGVASVFCVSGAEQLAQRDYLASEGGERAAYIKAVGALKSLPENSKLICGEDEG